MTSLANLARRFLRLGVLGFGGPAAHIAMMRDEFVTREQWFDDAEFMEMVGAVNLVPGPNSTELAMHIGHRRAGGRGLIVAGLTFIVPAVLIVGLMAWLYVERGTDPVLVDLRWGILPVIVGIVAHATWALGRSTLRSPTPALVAVGAASALLAGLNELLVLVVAGLTMVTVRGVGGAIARNRTSLPAVVIGLGLTSTRPSVLRVAAVFLEIGAVLYGSGYVLVAFLEGRLVDHLGWLTTPQMLDAVAVGQITPGPVFSTATFVGWQVAGPWGSLAATVGIFAPSFLFVALLGPLTSWLRRSDAGRGFLDGVVAASLGLMAGALVRIADAALIDPVTVAVAAASTVLLATRRAGTTTLVLAGVVLGVARLAVA